MLYYTVLYCMCSVIACTARPDQVVCTGVAPRSSLAQRGMARIRMLVLARPLVINVNLQGEAWPDQVERLLVEHDFAMFRLSFGFIVPSIVRFYCVALPCLAFRSTVSYVYVLTR